MRKNALFAVTYAMSRLKVLAALFLGTLSYVIISIGFGPQGKWAQAQLREQKQLITANLQHIQQIHNNLTVEYQGLRVDPEVIAAKARVLGYKNADEMLVRISGYAPSIELVPETGVPLMIGKIDYIPEWLCKVSGVCIFCFFMVIFVMQDLRKKVRSSSIAHLQEQMCKQSVNTDFSYAPSQTSF